MSTTADVRAARGKIASTAASVARAALARAAHEGRTEVTVTLPTEERLALSLSDFAEFIGGFVTEARADGDDIVAKQDAVLAEISSLVIE